MSGSAPGSPRAVDRKRIAFGPEASLVLSVGIFILALVHEANSGYDSRVGWVFAILIACVASLGTLTSLVRWRRMSRAQTVAFCLLTAIAIFTDYFVADFFTRW